MIAIMKLSDLQIKIVEFAEKQLGASGGIKVSNNPPGISLADKETLKKFMDFIIWDYNTHIVFDAFLRGRIPKRKYEAVTEAVGEIVESCKKLK